MTKILAEWAILGNKKTTKVCVCSFCKKAIPKETTVAVRVSDNSIAHIECAFPLKK